MIVDLVQRVHTLELALQAVAPSMLPAVGSHIGNQENNLQQQQFLDRKTLSLGSVADMINDSRGLAGEHQQHQQQLQQQHDSRGRVNDESQDRMTVTTNCEATSTSHSSKDGGGGGREAVCSTSRDAREQEGGEDRGGGEKDEGSRIRTRSAKSRDGGVRSTRYGGDSGTAKGAFKRTRR